uniref:lysosome-associated membrane glycoprotein 3 n=1 Tax=Semicossyphus pulcher TaxID=241346 RepID=UPI0037E96E0D
MTLKAHTGGWCLFFLAAVIPGVHLHGNSHSVQPASDSEMATEAQIYQPSEAISPNVQDNSSSIQPHSDSELPTEAQIYQPVLQPTEAIPPIGTYTLRTPAGIPCIKAKMGVEYIAIDKKTWYLSLDPTRVRTSGYCNKDEAVLSLTLPYNGASLQLVFKKKNRVFSITKVTAHVSPLPVCKGCANKTYSGMMAHEKMFQTATGQSYKCVSANLLLMSTQLKVKLVPLQMQAFTLQKGTFGKEVECWADYNKRVIPIIIGSVVVCIILIAVITYLFIKDRRTDGYERL